MMLTLLLAAPTAAALFCLAARSRRAMEWANMVAFGAAVAMGARLLYEVLERRVVTECGEFFRADALSAWMVLLISVVSFGTALYAGPYFRRDLAAGAVTPGRVKEFFVLTPLFTAGMLLVVLANNLGVMWFALEATALSSVLLVALYNRRTSLEAAWKYVMLGSIGLALALLGTVFTYAAAIEKGSTRPAQFQLVALHGGDQPTRPADDQAGVCPGPCGLRHQSRPGSHAHVAAGRPQRGTLADERHALRRLAQGRPLRTPALSYSRHRLPGLPFSRTLLLVFGLGSMCVAAPFILVQTNLKRLLAYSSLEHVGLICVGIGLNTPLTIFGALLHMGYHALTKPVLFFAAGNIHQSCHTLQMRAIGPGLIKILPLTVVCMGAAGAAAIGLPPFGLFYSEMTMLNGGFSSGWTRDERPRAGRNIGLVLRHSLPVYPHPVGRAQGRPRRGCLAGGRIPRHRVHARRVAAVHFWLPEPLSHLMRKHRASSREARFDVFNS